MTLIRLALHTSLAIGLACSSSAFAQGSQAVIGGGCPNRGAPTITGQLAVGTTLNIDDPGCFTGQGGFGVMFFGVRLPQTQWVSLRLSASITGAQPCDVVLLPVAGLQVSSLRPFSLPIPSNPALRGAQISLQTICNECGFAGCYDLLTQGIEITIG